MFLGKFSKSPIAITDPGPQIPANASLERSKEATPKAHDTISGPRVRGKANFCQSGRVGIMLVDAKLVKYSQLLYAFAFHDSASSLEGFSEP